MWSCATLAGENRGLLGAFTRAATKPGDRSVAEGIVLVTAHVEENETDIAQAVLGGCAAMAGLVAEAV